MTGSTDGAYGLRVAGLAAAADLLGHADDRWPGVVIEQRLNEGAMSTVDHLGGRSARLSLPALGRIELEREPGRATFSVVRRLAPAELVHPYLAPVAAVVGRWHGRESFHAGAVAEAGRVWGILGARESGKSSTLARLAREGREIVCDDLLVLDGSRVFAGPRSIDLRSDAARRLRQGRAAGVVGARERWRLTLPPLGGELRLQGWIVLRWGDAFAVRHPTPTETFGLLAEHAGLRIGPSRPETLLDLAGYPCVEVRRPRGWRSLGRTVQAVEAVIAG